MLCNSTGIALRVRRELRDSFSILAERRSRMFLVVIGTACPLRPAVPSTLDSQHPSSPSASNYPRLAVKLQHQRRYVVLRLPLLNHMLHLAVEFALSHLTSLILEISEFSLSFRQEKKRRSFHNCLFLNVSSRCPFLLTK